MQYTEEYSNYVQLDGHSKMPARWHDGEKSIDFSRPRTFGYPKHEILFAQQAEFARKVFSNLKR